MSRGFESQGVKIIKINLLKEAEIKMSIYFNMLSDLWSDAKKICNETNPVIYYHVVRNSYRRVVCALDD